MEVMNIKRKRVMILFIEAAEKMLRESGLASVSIRKVASEVGYNSATLYNYFEDLEHLILFASVRYLREYVASLQKALTDDMSAYDKYRTIYRCFNAYAFKEPEIFHNMFFGKHSDLLGDVLRTYYQELFPQELQGLSPKMKQMLQLGTMYERDAIMMRELIAEGYLTDANAANAIETIIALHQYYLHEAMIAESRSDSKQSYLAELAPHFTEKFREKFLYIMEGSRGR